MDEFSGTASELIAALGDGNYVNDDGGLTVNNVTRKIKENLLTLEKSSHIKALFNRTKAARMISLTKMIGDGVFSGAIPSPPDGDGEADTGMS